MAVVFDEGAPTQSRSTFARIVNDETNRSVFYQIVVFGLIAWVAWYLFTNTAHNLETRGMSSGFGFLGSTAGFSIAWTVIPYEPTNSYGYVFLVGIVNTLVVSLTAIVFTTILGFFIGVFRLSRNWLVATLASWYVEIIRNTPLLLQILFWYTAVFSLLPRPKQSIEILGMFPLNNRGFYYPAPVPGDGFWMTMLAIVVGIVLAYVIAVRAKRKQIATGERSAVALPVLGAVIGLPVVVYLVTGQPLAWDQPELKGFNFVGGGSVPPAFCALFLALVIYHAAYIAENVRAGIMSVTKGQTEAAYSLGLRPSWTMRLVIIPQAMRAIIPPLISTWMTVVKNSSLAVAIGYPDVVAVFMQTSLNQSGHAIEIVAMVMLFYSVVSLTISAALNYYNKLIQLKER
ncbi:MAG: amino acid ABC transporter permease [Ectothiorhodospiraceae bacterium]|nr:amino acid ABC transporter permease [Ectothiorhodospiraceae bacterium]